MTLTDHELKKNSPSKSGTTNQKRKSIDIPSNNYRKYSHQIRIGSACKPNNTAATFPFTYQFNHSTILSLLRRKFWIISTRQRVGQWTSTTHGQCRRLYKMKNLTPKTQCFNACSERVSNWPRTSLEITFSRKYLNLVARSKDESYLVWSNSTSFNLLYYIMTQGHWVVNKFWLKIKELKWTHFDPNDPRALLKNWKNNNGNIAGMR